MDCGLEITPAEGDGGDALAAAVAAAAGPLDRISVGVETFAADDCEGTAVTKLIQSNNKKRNIKTCVDKREDDL